MRNIFFLSSFLGLLLTSCSPTLTPFTQKLYEENKWTNDELKQIQFYISDDREGTPCLFHFSPKEDRFAISFEKSENPKFLMFGPNPKLSNRYALLAKDWEKRSGIISYDGKEYHTSSDAAWACLMVDLKRAHNLEKSTKVVKGAKVN